MSNQWHYRLLGEEFGPVSTETVKSLIEAGTLSDSDELRSEGSSTWVTAAQALRSSSAAAASAVSVDAAAADDDVQWYCRVAGQELGPVAFDDLVRFAENGELTADEEVKYGATGKWRKVGAIGRLVSVLPFRETTELRPSASPTAAATPDAPAASGGAAAAGRIHSAAEQPTWYAWIRGVEFGPASLVQLSQWLTTGQLGPADFVKQGPTGAWLPSLSVTELLAQMTMPAAPPSSPGAPRDVAKATASSASPPTAPVAAATSRPVVAPASDQNKPAPSSEGPAGMEPPHPAPPAERKSFAAPPEDVPAVRSTSSPGPATSHRPPPSAWSPPAKPAPRPATKSPARSTSNRGEMLAPLLQPKALGAIAAIAVAVLIFFGGSLLFQGTGGDIKKLEALQQILVEYRQVRDKQGSSEWTAFAKKAKETVEPIVKELEKTASRHAPQKQYLLWAARDRLPTMLSGESKVSEAAANEFEGNLYDAAKFLGVAKGEPPATSATARAAAASVESPNDEGSSNE